MARRNYIWDGTVKTLHLHICISTAPEMLHVNLFHVLNPIGGVLASPLEGGAVLSASESSDAIINMTLCGCQQPHLGKVFTIIVPAGTHASTWHDAITAGMGPLKPSTYTSASARRPRCCT